MAARKRKPRDQGYAPVLKTIRAKVMEAKRRVRRDLRQLRGKHDIASYRRVIVLETILLSLTSAPKEREAIRKRIHRAEVNVKKFWSP